MPSHAIAVTSSSDLDRPSTAQAALSGQAVLITINSDGGGGVELLAGILRQDLERLGAEVDVIFLYPKGTSSNLAKLAGIARAAREVLQRRPDVVMAFQPTSAAVASVGGRLSGCRARIIHQSNMPQSTHWVPRLMDRVVGSLGFYSCNIANSAATEAAFAGYPPSYRRRMRRIDHGIAYQPPQRERAEVLAHFGIPDDQPIILSCARLVEQKSLHTVVEALPMIGRGRFVIVGRGPEQQRLERLAVEAGVLNRVHFLGHIENSTLPDLYAASDVFVFPSLWETFGLALVEAAFQGLPSVSSNLDTCREVLAADVPGPTRFVETWDAGDWAKAIKDVLADPTAKAHAQEFATIMRQRHSMERMLVQYEDLYREMVG